MNSEQNDSSDLGPKCKVTGIYESRCVHCGAEPLNASVMAPRTPPGPALETVCNLMRKGLKSIEDDARKSRTAGTLRRSPGGPDAKAGWL